jgi:hypothetical protein
MAHQAKGEFRIVADTLHIPGFGGPRVRLCYVTDDGRTLGVPPWGDTLAECRADWEAMGKAFDKPTLDYGRDSAP